MNEPHEFRLKLGPSHIKSKLKSLETYREWFPRCDVRFTLQGENRVYKTYVDRSNRIKLNEILREYPNAKPGDFLVFTPLSGGNKWMVKLEIVERDTQATLDREEDPEIIDLLHFIDGEEYRFSQINQAIGFKAEATTPKGILVVPESRSKVLLLKMNLKSDLYKEEFDPESEIAYYIEQGLPEQGHQTLSRGNKRIVDNIEKNVYLFVKTKEQASDLWVFRGIWRVESFDPAYVSNQMTPQGEKQKVFRFKLVKKSNSRSVISEVVTLGAQTPSHTSIEWALIFLGKYSGYQTWITSSDRNKTHLGEPIGSDCIKELPDLGLGKDVKKIVENIDILWLEHNKIVAAFEVEHTTNIQSGLARMGDLVIAAPNLSISLFIVAPGNRRDKLERELKRPTFRNLHRRVKYISYSQILDRVAAALKIIELGGTLTPYFLIHRAEEV